MYKFAKKESQKGEEKFCKKKNIKIKKGTNLWGKKSKILQQKSRKKMTEICPLVVNTCLNVKVHGPVQGQSTWRWLFLGSAADLPPG